MAKNSQTGYGFNLGGPHTLLAPRPVISTRSPLTSDTGYELATKWINTSTSQAWHLTNNAGGAATWALSSPGASDVDTLTGDGGGAISPAGGNITLAGGTNLTTAGGGSTVTFNLDAAISLATSVTSPLYTSTAGSDLLVTSIAGQDIILKMGDAAGANKVSFTDTADAEVFAIDSNGGLTTLTALTVVGAFTQTAGIVSISEDNSANAVGIANGTTARAVSIASSAAAHTVTIGSATGAASLDLVAGTGNFTLDGVAATTYDIGATTVAGTVIIGGTAQTGTLTIGPSSAIMILNLANADGAKTINIGAGVDGNTLSMGNGINTSAQIINMGNGASAADSTINILSGIATGGTSILNMANGDYAKTVNIATGIKGNTINVATGINDTAQTINISTGASAANSDVNILTGVGTLGAATLNMANNTRVTTVGIADIAPAAARTFNICGGNSAQNDTFNLLTGNPSANAQTVNILSGVPSGGTQILNLLTQTGQAGTANIGTGAAMANPINIGGTGACVLAIGNTQTGGSISLGDAMTGGTIDIGGSGAQTGTLNIAGGTGAQTINIANSTGGKTVKIGTGAGTNAMTIGSNSGNSSMTINVGTGSANFATSTTAHTTTLGSTTGAASTIIQSGTGRTTMTGTVKEITSEFTTRSGDSITFTQSPLTGTAANTGGVATGATGDINLLSFQEGIIMEQFVLGAGQTILKPVMTATGLLISGDQTNVEGYEINFGAARANSRHSFTIGTSAAFFAEMSFRADDISGLEPCLMGFRRTQANEAQGNLANYTDFIGYGLNDAVAGGDAVIQTQLNTGGINSTDTNDAWADTATHTLAVLVSAAGVVTFTFDGGAPTATQAYTFDNGDVVHFFWRHEFNAALPDDIEWLSFKCGFQA